MLLALEGFIKNQEEKGSVTLLGSLNVKTPLEG